MAKLSQKLIDIVSEKARKDALTIVMEGHTRSFIAERYLSRLKISDQMHDTPFFGRGEQMFNLYSLILNENVDHLRGKGIPGKGSPFPTWNM